MIVTIKFLIFSLAIISLAVAIIGFVLLKIRSQLQNSYSTLFAAKNKGAVEELEPVDINGTKQWIHVRGRNKNNPLLLFLHGGPGWSNIGWYDAIQRPWENHFTVVQWDQRQAGKSYAPNLAETISHQQYISDTEAIISYLRDKFQQDKIFIMGTSYGTYLGMQMAKRHPDWLHAYIGIGQVVTMKEHPVEEYRLLLEHAHATDNQSLIATLNRLAPFPDPSVPEKSYIENVVALTDLESEIEKAYPASLSSILKANTHLQWLSPLYTLKDHYHRKFGENPAGINPKNAFYYDFFKYDLPKEVGSDFDVPIFFFTGRHDFHVAYTLTDRWFRKIEAPYKEQVWFEQSAHAAHLTEPYEFSKALIEKVLLRVNMYS